MFIDRDLLLNIKPQIKITYKTKYWTKMYCGSAFNFSIVLGTYFDINIRKLENERETCQIGTRKTGK
jgi:hypothetical protein